MSEKITNVCIKKFFCSLRNWISLESEIKMKFKFFFLHFRFFKILDLSDFAGRRGWNKNILGGKNQKN